MKIFASQRISTLLLARVEASWSAALTRTAQNASHVKAEASATSSPARRVQQGLILMVLSA
jgi:hypothetical protein